MNKKTTHSLQELLHQADKKISQSPERIIKEYLETYLNEVLNIKISVQVTIQNQKAITSSSSAVSRYISLHKDKLLTDINRVLKNSLGESFVPIKTLR
mgnify:CR=1 FL=1